MSKLILAPKPGKGKGDLILATKPESEFTARKPTSKTPEEILQKKILKHVQDRPYISVDGLCKHLDIPIKVLAKAIAGYRPIPEKYLKPIAKELSIK